MKIIATNELVVENKTKQPALQVSDTARVTLINLPFEYTPEAKEAPNVRPA